MFRARVILFLLVFSLFTLSLRANTVGAGGASDALVFYFDENGNGAFGTNGGPLTPDPGILATDPNTRKLALLYQLPVFVNTVMSPSPSLAGAYRNSSDSRIQTAAKAARTPLRCSIIRTTWTGRTPWPTSGFRQ
jgi:hypothetical protein